MVEIECPYCNRDIELDDDEFGLFECPYCEEKFVWEETDSIGIKQENREMKSHFHFLLLPGLGICFLIIILLFFIWTVMSFANAMACGWQTTC